MGLRQTLSNNYHIYILYYFLRFVLPHYIFGSKKWDTYCVKKRFKEIFGFDLNLDNPQTLNEKLQWLKLNARDDLLTTCADKYRVRDWLAKQFGEEYLIPLLYRTEDWKDITPENIPNEPCVIKTNASNADYIIIRDKSKVDWDFVRNKFRKYLKINYYYSSHEWYYKNIKRCIIVEKLLQTKANKIPNDYKLTYFNGQLQFIYCSIDREGINKRNIYSPDWKPMPFSWVDVASGKKLDSIKGPDILPPPTLKKMIEFGNKISKNFKYVRVDFYDVDGKLYFGEITLCHGCGFDVIYPKNYDLELGNKLILDK